MNVRIVSVGICAITAAALLMSITSVATPVHRIIFSVIPADGPMQIQERLALDSSVSSYLITGNTQKLSSFSAIEQSHMNDVRVRLLALGFIAIIGIIAIAMIRPTAKEYRIASFGLLGIGIATSLAFEPLFIVFHEVLFTAGNWDLPSDQFAITQVYPIGFFVSIWLTILLSSWGLLYGLSRMQTVYNK